MPIGSQTTADDAVAVTPNDSENLPQEARAIYVGTAGNLKIKTALGNDVTFPNVQDGSIIPCRALQVYATGTTADNIVALY